MQIEEIEAKAIEVLAWGQSVFRPGTDTHVRFGAAIDILRKEDGLLPTHAKRSILTRLVEMRDAARELGEIEQATPGAVPGELLAVERMAGDRIAYLKSKVSFDDIDDILAGSWQDSDLGAEIRALRDAMKAYVEAAPSPAP